MPTVSGTSELLSGGEDVYRETPGGPRLTHAKGTQRYGGGIEGDGYVDWLVCYRPDRTARYDGKASTGTWEVIAGTGTGDLAGMTGRGGFEAPGGPKVEYHLDYELEG